MKVSRIKINNFQQFKDFELDLTYPKGHEKEGQPLEKVCIIGQSGTGKTTLLEIIRDAMQFRNRPQVPIEKIVDEYFELEFITPKGQILKRKYLDQSNWVGESIGREEKLIYFPAETVKNYDAIINGETETPYYDYSSSTGKSNIEYFSLIKGVYNIAISEENANKIWLTLIQEVKEYQKKEAGLIFEIGLATTNRPEDEKLAKDNFTIWKKSTPNPLEGLANQCLNPILKRTNLKIGSKLLSLDLIEFLPFETLNGKRIPSKHLSTGTKQIALTLAPLFFIKPKDAIILIDEPERSLYPDIQTEIIDSVLNLITDSQLIVATHSPLIAASFDPWEIVELKFDYETGKVFRELYFEGDRHVDNYKFFPKFLRYDSILRKIFDLETDSHPDREDKLDELAGLGSELDMLREDGMLKSQQAQKKWTEYKDLAEKTDSWIVNDPGASYGKEE